MALFLKRLLFLDIVYENREGLTRVFLLARLYEVQGELLLSASAFPSHCDKVLYASFSKVHISTAAHQKAFIFEP